MVAGATCLITVTCGFPIRARTGLLTAMAIGLGNLPMDGRGSATSLGAGHRITTDAGSGTTTRGHGGRVPDWATVPCGRPHTSPSGDGAAAGALTLASAVGAASVGSRSGRVTGSIRGGVDTAAGLAWWTSRMSIL